MCNAKGTCLLRCSSFSSQVGKATEAVERSFKRQRTSISSSDSRENLASAALDASFNFDQVFDSINSFSSDGDSNESFPSISWPSDSEDETPVVASRHKSSLSLKRDRSGGALFRSKSFKKGLSSLSDANLAAKSLREGLSNACTTQRMLTTSVTELPARTAERMLTTAVTELPLRLTQRSLHFEKILTDEFVQSTPLYGQSSC